MSNNHIPSGNDEQRQADYYDDQPGEYRAYTQQGQGYQAQGQQDYSLEQAAYAAQFAQEQQAYAEQYAQQLAYQQQQAAYAQQQAAYVQQQQFVQQRQMQTEAQVQAQVQAQMLAQDQTQVQGRHPSQQILAQGQIQTQAQGQDSYAQQYAAQQQQIAQQRQAQAQAQAQTQAQGRHPSQQMRDLHAQQGQRRRAPQNQNDIYGQQATYAAYAQQNGGQYAAQEYQYAAQGNQHRHRIGTKAEYKAHQKELKQQAKADKKAEKARLKAQKKASKRKWPLPLKIGMGLAIAVVIVGIGLVAGVTMMDKFLQGNKSDAEMNSIKETLKGTASIDEPFYMLLIGTDARAGEEDYGSRSDSMILARIDPVDYVVTLVSIQRDIKMGSDSNAYKFNAEYANGGVAQCISAVQTLLGVDISHYAEVNFEAFTNMVNAIGGIDVYIGETIDDYRVCEVVINEGWQHLDGFEALAVCRARHYGDDDYTRSSYQRTVIQTVINKIMAQPVTELPKILATVSGYVSTDLAATDIFNLAIQFKNADDITMYSADLPSTQAEIGGVSYVILDMVDTKAMLKIVDEGGDPNSVNLTQSGVYIGTRIENEAGKYDENGNVINSN